MRLLQNFSFGTALFFGGWNFVAALKNVKKFCTLKLASFASIEIKGSTPAIVIVTNCNRYNFAYLLLKWMPLCSM